jgi:uncharacterized protein (DUF885 family)
VPLDRFFDHYYRRRPVNATFTGIHAFDHELPDWSPEGLEACAGEMRALRADLERDVASRAWPVFPDRVDRDLAIDFLDIQIAEMEGAHFQRRNPALFTGEAIFSIIALITREFAPIADRLEAVVSRLRAIPGFLAQARRTIGDRAVPDDWLARARRECEAAAILLDRGLPILLRSEPVASALADAVLAAAAPAQAAFADFAGWLTRDVTPNERVACGPDFFDLLLARGHRCTRSRVDLLAEARAAIDEARARLDEYARRADPSGWPAVQSRLAELHPSPGDYLAAFQRTWDACRAAALTCRLVTWPDFPIRYVPIPPHTREAAPMLYFLFYRSPAPFDHLPMHDYVVPASCNQGVITLNHVVHHGAIGHHVQNFSAYRSASRIGQIAAVDTASRIGMFSGGTLAEGWACYATDLMEEVGFLSALECVSQQHGRVRQLARAVVDIELHQGTMTREEAVAFYRDWTGMPDDAARSEVMKNGMFPGAAVMYWLGTEGLHALRGACARSDGDRFSLQAFHDRVLSYGAIPVPLIADLMGGSAA